MAGVKGKSGGARKNSGGARPGAGRPKKSKTTASATPAPAKRTAKEAPKQRPATQSSSSATPPPPISVLHSDPRDYLMAVMNDGTQEEKLRVDAAKALMPFIHGRIGEGGKKDAKADAAKKAGGGKFAAAAPPLKLVGRP